MDDYIIRKIIAFIEMWIKTSLLSLIAIVLIMITIPVLLFRIDFTTWLTATSGSISAIATGIICWYTVKSVKEVIKSNEENKRYNSDKERKDSFEKRFTLLLQEHNNYLNKLIEADNKLYNLDYILQCTGYESLSIIRGNVKHVKSGEIEYYYSNKKLFIKVNFWEDKNSKKIYLNPGAGFISQNQLIKNPKMDNLYISEDGTLWHVDHYSNMKPKDIAFQKKEYIKLSKKYSDDFKNAQKLIPTIIKDSNNISKNILSPYMRIVYHLLKSASEHTENKDDMKKYTNIVRSIIPNDILMLIAINSMYFYKSRNEENDEIKRWGDLFHDTDTITPSVLNDYYKYYALLIKCDFFEHLSMRFQDIIDKANDITLRVNLSGIKVITCKSDRIIRKTLSPMRGFLFYGDINYNLKLIYLTFHKATLNLDTDILVLFFYYNKDYRVEKLKENIMDDFFYTNRDSKLEGRSKKYHGLDIYTNCSIINEKRNIIFLARDFYGFYTNGSQIPTINSKNQEKVNE